MKNSLATILAGLLLAVLLLGGCASVPVAPEDAELRVWTRLVFHWQWPAGKAPAWHREVWLTDAVIAPLLYAHQDDIRLWRVHRRAVRARGGHFFSWYIYADAALGDALYAQVQAQATVQQLLNAGWLAKVVKQRVRSQAVPPVAATSDRHWPASVQVAWPWFAMGVSASWLGLIDQLSKPPVEADAEALDQYYLGVSDSVDSLWQFQGGHAFLHHLNAIFGYVPVLTGRDRLQNF